MPSQPLRFSHKSPIQVSLPTPWDLTNFAISSVVRDRYGIGEAIAEFEVAVQQNPATNLPGLVLLTIQDPADLQKFIPGKGDYAFDVKLLAAGAQAPDRIPFIALYIEAIGTP